MLIPTPILRDADYEKNLYHAQAMAQMRILKQQMALGHLSSGYRFVEIAPGVVARCEICFEREVVQIVVTTTTTSGSTTSTTTTSTTTTTTAGTTTTTTSGGTTTTTMGGTTTTTTGGTTTTTAAPYTWFKMHEGEISPPLDGYGGINWSLTVGKDNCSATFPDRTDAELIACYGNFTGQPLTSWGYHPEVLEGMPAGGSIPGFYVVGDVTAAFAGRIDEYIYVGGSWVLNAAFTSVPGHEYVVDFNFSGKHIDTYYVIDAIQAYTTVVLGTGSVLFHSLLQTHTEWWGVRA